jgi:hypothetical protein
MLNEKELHKLYFPEQYEDYCSEEEKSLEDYEEEIIDSCDYELIKSKLGEEVADSLFLYEK